jgi:DEAD/DEAH box helicase domain-containing protein
MALITATTSDLDAFVTTLGHDPRAVHIERLPARAARFGDLQRPLPPIVRDHLGVDRLWSHQAEAIDLVRAGTSVAIATGTASGKSLCYQAPIAESVADGLRAATSLLIFPTKALAQDQLRAITAMDVPRLVAATYDGDSGPEERTWVRANANVLLTNPEMLHHGILPNHARWATFLLRLRYVVVDELHLLRGIFGTHVAHLLRRLRRLCASYGSSPTFVFSSATIGEPGRLAGELCGLPVTPITEDGSPRGERLFVLWNPAARGDRVDGPDPLDPLDTLDPLDDLQGFAGSDGLHDGDGFPDGLDGSAGSDGFDDGDGSGSLDAFDDLEDDLALAPGPRRRASANRETATLVARLVRDGRRTIAFCRSRKGTEIVAADVTRHLPGALADLVRPYRAGYLTAERREIEADLFAGRLLGVVATSALELGVDIGGLDACVLNGFPGTIASMWQQAGRAGRETQPSIAILVAGDDQLDQWLMAHPDDVFTREPEPAVINPTNPFVLLPHLACAAYEQPLSHADEAWWPDALDDGVRDLVVDDRLRLRPRGRGSRREPIAVWAGRGWPAHGVGLRGSSADEVRIALADGTLIGTADLDRAGHLVHPGAVYLHRGQAYRVHELDLADHAAIVEPFDGSEYTQPRTETQISILHTDATRPVGGSALALGTVRVVSRVVGYKRFDRYSGDLLSAEELFLPPSELTTRGFWYTVPAPVLADAGIDLPDWPGTLHAVEHAAIGMMPLFTICDRWDVGGVSTALHADTGHPTITIYDAYAGGAGIAELGFAAADEHLGATLEVIASCPCEDGCPSCVQSPKCGNGNEPLDKAGAIALLRTLLDR